MRSPRHWRGDRVLASPGRSAAASRGGAERVLHRLGAGHRSGEHSLPGAWCPARQWAVAFAATTRCGAGSRGGSGSARGLTPG
ncbi:hypothetical protein SAMN04489718_3713 [Actinopolyspora saharensis]|uniref:Uncharacterized protein n=1 Tax=Actinopolyspora saharensis TaxID=995062 RepID=A0A1H1GKY1_9ACTN|nr:hypothetical protein SAMN04489718_3713 [Actinopolyspora saharensis]